MKTHVLTIHEGKESFKCIICNDKFVNKQKFNNHIQLVHEEKNTCEFCNMSFQIDGELIAHIAYIHESKKMEERNTVTCKLLFHLLLLQRIF